MYPFATDVVAITLGAAVVPRSNVKFGELSQILRDLGFAESRRGRFWYFEHAPTETWFKYRPYRRNERVSALDLDMTRRHLDLRSVLDEQAFDDTLKKVTA